MNKRREILSFVRRNGRITKGQKKHLDLNLDTYSIDKYSDSYDFNTIFGNNNPVILDIGFGNGEDLFVQSSTHLEYNFIGIEVYLSGIGALLKKVAANHLTNIRVINNDAIKILQQYIPVGSISRVQLLFPDPWPKKKHQKRRLIKQDFISDVYKVLGANGVLHVVTDCFDYAEHISSTIDTFGKFNLYDSSKHEGIHFDRISTRFEKRGLSKGNIIKEFSFIKS